MNSRGTSLFGPCVVWLLACAPFGIDESALAMVSRTALAALPWIAYSGLPRASRADRDRSLHGLAFELALFLPPVALGAWIDLATGLSVRTVVTTAAASLVLCFLMGLGARLSARTPGGSRAYAASWFVAVALWPILEGALRLGGAPLFGAAPRWMTLASNASPLGWILAGLRVDDLASTWPWAALAVALALFSVGYVVMRSSTAEART